MGTQKLQTSPYHPQTNGQCERFNSTLIGTLGTLPQEKKSERKNHIGALVHAYNCTQNSTTGFSPYYLMYRRQPHLPVRCHLRIGTTLTYGTYHLKIHTEYARMCQMGHKMTKTCQAKEAQHRKLNYDKRRKAAALEVGDMVLVHVPTLKGHHKIQN